MEIIKLIRDCNNNPTCENCDYCKKHIGCYFRGKTPREWRLDELKKGTERERV